MPQQLYEQRNFAGGMTDHPKHGSADQCSFLKNFYISDNKSLVVREGSRLLVPSYTPGGGLPTALSNLGDDILVYLQGSLQRVGKDEDDNVVYREIGSIFGDDTDLKGVSVGRWKNHLLMGRDLKKPVKVFKNREKIYQAVTIGLPKVNISQIRQTTGGMGQGASYVYAFAFKYSYTVGNENFIDYGPVTLRRVPDAFIGTKGGSTTRISFANLPSVANGAGDNYDTANIELEVYRTVDGGTTFYRVGSVRNGSSSLTDSVTDEDLVNREVIYTAGGIPDYDAPPPCEFVHVLDNTAYYAHIQEGTDVRPSTVVQSVPGAPSAAPASNLIEVDDVITGMSSIQSVPLIFCENSVYRIEGVYEGDGSGAPRAVRISDTVGCIDNNSIVQAKDLIYWAGRDRIYMSDGYKVVALTDHLDTTYQNIVLNSSTIKGIYDEDGERIYWTVADDRLSEDTIPAGDMKVPNGLFVLDVRAGRGGKGSFGFYSGDFGSFYPLSLLYRRGSWYRGDFSRVVFRHEKSLKSDIAVIPEVSPAQWSELAIPWGVDTLEHNFGSDSVRKKVGRFGMTGNSSAKFSASVELEVDGGSLVSMSPINSQGTFLWGDPTFFWGDLNFRWGALGLFNVSRRQPSRHRRFTYMRHKIRSAPLVLFDSSEGNLGQAILSGGGLTLVKEGMEWPEKLASDFLVYNGQRYRISSVIGSRLYVQTPPDFPTTPFDFQIEGRSKSQDMNIIALSQTYSLSTRTQEHSNG